MKQVAFPLPAGRRPARRGQVETTPEADPKVPNPCATRPALVGCYDRKGRHSVTEGPYWEQVHPWRGTEPARAWFESDAPGLDLSGDWKFRWSPRADTPTDFADPATRDD